MSLNLSSSSCLSYFCYQSSNTKSWYCIIIILHCL
nr:MAG TPA: hypothetical protein [Bacteriophage sp.]